MSTPTAPESRVLEEASTISDQLMVLRSSQTPTVEEPEDGGSQPQPIVFRADAKMELGQIPAKIEKKGILKRTKDRNSTPRPILKGGGRKRFSFSPSPELKQTFKKSVHNDLIEERGRELRNKRNLLADLSEVADFVNITPPEPGRNSDEESILDKGNQEHGANIPPLNECKEMGLIGSAFPNTVEGPPDSGLVTGGEVDAGREELNPLHHLRSKTNESTPTIGSLDGVLVNLPGMEIETNPLFESVLEPCQLEKSHDLLAVSLPMQPKKNNMLLIANFESAEMLDTVVAQPLLAGGHPEVDQMSDDLSMALLSAAEPPLRTCADANSEPVQMTAKTPPMLLPATEIAMPTPLASFVPSLEEFPPLCKRKHFKNPRCLREGCEQSEAGLSLVVEEAGRVGPPRHGTYRGRECC